MSTTPARPQATAKAALEQMFACILGQKNASGWTTLLLTQAPKGPKDRNVEQ